jgi:hypothetical protein
MTDKSLEYASDASHPPLFLPEREPYQQAFTPQTGSGGFFASCSTFILFSF